MWVACTLLVYWPDFCGFSGSHGWPLVQLVARLCLVWRLPFANARGWVIRQLDASMGPGASAGSLVGRAGFWNVWFQGHWFLI